MCSRKFLYLLFLHRYARPKVFVQWKPQNEIVCVPGGNYLYFCGKISYIAISALILPTESHLEMRHMSLNIWLLFFMGRNMSRRKANTEEKLVYAISGLLTAKDKRMASGVEKLGIINQIFLLSNFLGLDGII